MNNDVESTANPVSKFQFIQCLVIFNLIWKELIQFVVPILQAYSEDCGPQLG